MLHGAYRLVDERGEPGWDPEVNAVSLFAGGHPSRGAHGAARAPRARHPGERLRGDGADRLYRGLRDARPYLEDLVSADEEGVPVVSVLDGHSHALAFIGAALGVPQQALGVDDFGQSGARGDLYRHYGIDAPAIARAAQVLLSGVYSLGPMPTLTESHKAILRREIEAIVGPGAVLADPDELLAYESDGLTLFRALADFVVFPTRRRRSRPS